MHVTSDTATRRIVIYAPDAGELSEEDAMARAEKELRGEIWDKPLWEFSDCERISDNRVAVVFNGL